MNAREKSRIRRSGKATPPDLRRAGTTKKTSRIPGVYVSEVVNTSLGKKKKVCFNIGGKWFFRMVNPDWRAPGRPKKSRNQKSEDRKQRAAITPVEHPDRGPGSTPVTSAGATGRAGQGGR